MRTRARCFDAVRGLKNAAKSAELRDVELKRRNTSGIKAAPLALPWLAALLMVSGSPRC